MYKRGFVSVIILLGVLVLAAGAYFFYTSRFPDGVAVMTPLPDSPTPTPIPTFEVDVTNTPSYIAKDTDSDARRKVDLFAIRNAIEQYAVDHEGTYPTKLSVLAPKYLSDIPKDPVTKETYSFQLMTKDTYQISAKLTDGTTYRVYDVVSQGKVDDGRRKEDLHAIRHALEIYMADKGEYPRRTQDLIPTYIKVLPKDPITKEEYAYTKTSATTYKIFAKLSDFSVYEETNP